MCIRIYYIHSLIYRTASFLVLLYYPYKNHVVCLEHAEMIIVEESNIAKLVKMVMHVAVPEKEYVDCLDV